MDAKEGNSEQDLNAGKSTLEVAKKKLGTVEGRQWEESADFSIPGTSRSTGRMLSFVEYSDSPEAPPARTSELPEKIAGEAERDDAKATETILIDSPAVLEFLKKLADVFKRHETERNAAEKARNEQRMTENTRKMEEYAEIRSKYTSDAEMTICSSHFCHLDARSHSYYFSSSDKNKKFRKLKIHPGNPLIFLAPDSSTTLHTACLFRGIFSSYQCDFLSHEDKILQDELELKKSGRSRIPSEMLGPKHYEDGIKTAGYVHLLKYLTEYLKNPKAYFRSAEYVEFFNIIGLNHHKEWSRHFGRELSDVLIQRLLSLDTSPRMLEQIRFIWFETSLNAFNSVLEESGRLAGPKGVFFKLGMDLLLDPSFRALDADGIFLLANNILKAEESKYRATEYANYITGPATLFWELASRHIDLLASEHIDALLTTASILNSPALLYHLCLAMRKCNLNPDEQRIMKILTAIASISPFSPLYFVLSAEYSGAFSQLSEEKLTLLSEIFGQALQAEIEQNPAPAHQLHSKYLFDAAETLFRHAGRMRTYKEEACRTHENKMHAVENETARYKVGRGAALAELNSFIASSYIEEARVQKRIKSLVLKTNILIVKCNLWSCRQRIVCLCADIQKMLDNIELATASRGSKARGHTCAAARMREQYLKKVREARETIKSHQDELQTVRTKLLKETWFNELKLSKLDAEYDEKVSDLNTFFDIGDFTNADKAEEDKWTSTEISPNDVSYDQIEDDEEEVGFFCDRTVSPTLYDEQWDQLRAKMAQLEEDTDNPLWSEYCARMKKLNEKYSMKKAALLSEQAKLDKVGHFLKDDDAFAVSDLSGALDRFIALLEGSATTGTHDLPSVPENISPCTQLPLGVDLPLASIFSSASSLDEYRRSAEPDAWRLCFVKAATKKIHLIDTAMVTLVQYCGDTRDSPIITRLASKEVTDIIGFSLTATESIQETRKNRREMLRNNIRLLEDQHFINVRSIETEYRVNLGRIEEAIKRLSSECLERHGLAGGYREFLHRPDRPLAADYIDNCRYIFDFLIISKYVPMDLESDECSPSPFTPEDMSGWFLSSSTGHQPARILSLFPVFRFDMEEYFTFLICCSLFVDDASRRLAEVTEALLLCSGFGLEKCLCLLDCILLQLDLESSAEYFTPKKIGRFYKPENYKAAYSVVSDLSYFIVARYSTDHFSDLFADGDFSTAMGASLLHSGCKHLFENLLSLGKQKKRQAEQRARADRTGEEKLILVTKLLRALSAVNFAEAVSVLCQPGFTQAAELEFLFQNGLVPSLPPMIEDAISRAEQQGGSLADYVVEADEHSYIHYILERLHSTCRTTSH